MEAIRKALSRSKDEKPLESSSSSVRGYTPGISHEELSNIEYTKTVIQNLSVQHLKSNRVLTDDSDEEIKQAYKMLRTQILQKLNANGWNSIAILSPDNNDGKTLTAVNLGISISRELKHTVVLVDMDLENPSVHQVFGLKPEFGLGDFVDKNAELQDVMINPNIDGLVIVPGKEPLIDCSEALASPRMISAVEEMRARYKNRVVICDLPPVLKQDDAISFIPYIDAVLIVIEDGKTSKNDLHRFSELLGDKPVLGTVLNKAR